jgi:hypothetical protein
MDLSLTLDITLVQIKKETTVGLVLMISEMVAYQFDYFQISYRL